MSLETDYRCEVCGGGFVYYVERVQRAYQRRKVRFYGCFAGHTEGPWRVIDDGDKAFMAQKPPRLNKRAVVDEAMRLLLPTHNPSLISFSPRRHRWPRRGIL